MQTTKVVFARNYKPFSLLIMLFTLSQWSHCGIVDGDYIIDSTLASGVRRIRFDDWAGMYNKYEIVEMISREDAITFARAQVGKRYDPLGIISLVLRRNIENRDKWFCSELVASVLGIKNRTWRLSPQFIWNLHKVLKGWVYG